jgi:hypothetical protein
MMPIEETCTLYTDDPPSVADDLLMGPIQLGHFAHCTNCNAAVLDLCPEVHPTGKWNRLIGSDLAGEGGSIAGPYGV